MARNFLMVVIGSIPVAFALILTLKALDASQPVAQIATVTLCGIGGLMVALLEARRLSSK